MKVGSKTVSSLRKKVGKNLHDKAFYVTTNGVLLNDDIMEFASRGNGQCGFKYRWT